LVGRAVERPVGVLGECGASVANQWRRRHHDGLSLYADGVKLRGVVVDLFYRLNWGYLVGAAGGDVDVLSVVVSKCD
jgi:hypothetical protein